MTATPASDAAPTTRWQQLADVLNRLEADDLALRFGDRMGPETKWRTVPYVYSGTRPDAPRAVWDRKKKKWVVEER